jgi:hypothetical protein
MKRSLVLYGVSGLLALAGCAPTGADGGAFAGSTPTDETVNLAIPAATAAAQQDGVRTSALLGEQADSYTLTRTVTAVVNTGTAWVLGLVKLIVSYPPTSVTGDHTAVWAPAPDPLAKKAWRLTVTRTAKHVFDWSFDAKKKTDPDSAFVTILSGTHTRAVDANDLPIENYGSGNFTLDWDAANTLPREVGETGNDVGVATFSYARLDPTSVTSINVDFNGVKDDNTGEIHNAIYRYLATPGAGGDFKYGSKQNAYPDNGVGTMQETLTIHSRWQESGAGRSDYQVVGGDLGATVVTATECWDPSFASVFMSTSYDASKSWGAESSCAFPTAQYSSEAP